jgi:hypothetical protein
VYPEDDEGLISSCGNAEVCRSFASDQEYERCETFGGKCPDVKHVPAF